MAGRQQQLNTVSGGLNRLRLKAGPDRRILHDLLNGYVNATGAAQSRPGTRVRHLLPTGESGSTRGMCAFRGEMVVFASAPVDDVPPGVKCEILTHPTNPDLLLKAIHFAGPFMGYLYVVAEFWGDEENYYHYWLESALPWQPNTVYGVGAMAAPTEANGYAYRAHRLGEPGVAWAPGVARAVGDEVEATVYNGFKYTVIDTLGANPRSGTVEPRWPTEDGATIDEDTNGAAPTPTPSSNPNNPSTALPPAVVDRYSNPGGSSPRAGVNLEAE